MSKEKQIEEILEKFFSTGNPKGVIRIIDICFSTFMYARFNINEDDGGPVDWYNDTHFTVSKQIEEIKGQLKQDLLKI